MAHFTEFWNVPETSKDGKRSSKGQREKARRGSLGSAAKATTMTAHHITSPIESIPPLPFERAGSPTIYYNPEFAFSNMNSEIQLGIALPQSPLKAVVVAQSSTDPLKSRRMPPSSPQPLSKTSESFMSGRSQPSSISVFRLSNHSDTPGQQNQRSGAKPPPINTSSWQASTSSIIHRSPTTPFPGCQTRTGGDEGYFSAHPQVAQSPVHPSPVHPSPVYPPYPTGATYQFTHQQSPVGFDQAQHQHRMQTPYQGQHRNEYDSQERYYY
ncbi:hypothetical protein MVEG_05967 [Podila verticillata NRRL 6337]|nr:hypothetical protein MVEG_05967 [Podila verticillata NRRL 6337]